MSFRFERLYLLLHLLSWAILFCFPFIGRENIQTSFLIKHSFQIGLLAIFFYLNMYLLIPKLLFRKRFGMYIFSVVLALLLINGWNYFYDNILPFFNDEVTRGRVRYRRRPFASFRFISTALSSILVYGISTSLKVINEYLKKEKQQHEIEKEKVQSELAFLKSQINPHFLFNTLNNIYSLASTQSPNTDKAILKLAELMRYMLEDSKGEKVPLTKEIEYLQNYLDLQKLRIPDSVKVELNIAGDIQGKVIEPLILIPFIENAFKHGISYSEKSFIYILLSLNDNQLILKVENSIPALRTERDSISGIGLSNVLKRLELLYHKNHELNIDVQEKTYTVKLKIEL